MSMAPRCARAIGVLTGLLTRVLAGVIIPEMAQSARNEPDVLLGIVGRHWGWALAFGILTVIAGILLVVWPNKSVLIAAIFLGIWLIISAVFRFVGAFGPSDTSGWVRVLMVIVAVLSVIAGLFILRDPGLGVVVLALVLSIYWIATGVIDVMMSIGNRELPRRWLVALTGVLGILAGLVIFANPVWSLVFLAWVLGIWLIVYGIITVVRAFMLRSAAASLAGGPSNLASEA
jgi:uncharacterized membrane protein HdeD (DUF308 family)